MTTAAVDRSPTEASSSTGSTGSMGTGADYRQDLCRAERIHPARCHSVAKLAVRRGAKRRRPLLRSPLFLRIRPDGGSGAVREGDHVSGLKTGSRAWLPL